MKVPLSARERLARRSAPTNLPLQLMMRERLIIDGNVISVTPRKLRVSFISNLVQPENGTIFVKMAFKRRVATWSPLTFLQKSSRSRLSVLGIS